MSYRLPPLNWLRTFEAAASLKSFTLAAEELNVTQSAVSHHIRLLEAHLGFKLFLRHPRSVSLTEMGSAYLPSLRNAFSEISLATNGLFGLEGKGLVNVRASVSFALSWLIPKLPDFRKQYPDIEIRLYSSISADSMEADACSIDIRYGDGQWPDYKATRLKEEHSIMVCSPGYLNSHRPMDGIHDLQKCDLIHVMGNDDYWDRLLRQSGIEIDLPTPRFRVDTAIAGMEVAAAGLGITLVGRGLARKMLRSGQLAQVLDASLLQPKGYYLLLTQQTRQHSAEALLFHDWILEQTRKEIESETDTHL